MADSARDSTAAVAVAGVGAVLVVTATIIRRNRGGLGLMLALVYVGLAVAVLLHLLHAVRQRRYDPFFAIFTAAALVYLEIAPGLIVATGRIGHYGTENVSQAYRASPPSSLNYLLVMTGVWILFLGPLFFFYRLRRADDSDEKTTLRLVMGSSWRAMCIGSSLFALLFIEQLVTHGLFFYRVGADKFSAEYAGLSTLTYSVVRLFTLSSFFLAGVLVVMRSKAETRQQRVWITWSLGIVATALLVPAVSNSRAAVLPVLGLVGWYLVASGRTFDLPTWTGRALLFGLLGVLVIEMALNLRPILASHGASGINVQIYSPLAGGGGLHRLDGVDLMARLEPAIARSGPAWGKAWTATPWVLGRRYVDQGGYRAFVATGQTTAKSWLSQRYLQVHIQDFYSACLTDLFGNFWWLGLPLAGLIFGTGYRFIRTRLLDLGSTSVPSLLVAAMLVGTWLNFEQEGQLMFFGWLTFAPIVGVLLLFPPLRRERVLVAQPDPVAVFDS